MDSTGRPGYRPNPGASSQMNGHLSYISARDRIPFQPPKPHITMPRFLVYAPDYPDRLEQRLAVRPRHLERVKVDQENKVQSKYLIESFMPHLLTRLLAQSMGLL